MRRGVTLTEPPRLAKLGTHLCVRRGRLSPVATREPGPAAPCGPRLPPFPTVPARRYRRYLYLAPSSSPGGLDPQSARGPRAQGPNTGRRPTGSRHAGSGREARLCEMSRDLVKRTPGKQQLRTRRVAGLVTEGNSRRATAGHNILDRTGASATRDNEESKGCECRRGGPGHNISDRANAPDFGRATLRKR